MATMIKKIEGQSGEGSGDGEKRGRKASKEVRRQQLIEATIDSRFVSISIIHRSAVSVIELNRMLLPSAEMS